MQRLKIARWADLNDPFELTPYASNTWKSRRLLDELKRDFHEKNGLLCFSRDWTNPLLWSHYGDKHRGIALGFDVDTSKLWTSDISYSEDRLLDPIQVESLFFTKALDWSYEQEVRLLVDLEEEDKEGHLYFFQFDAALQLAEVVLGPECQQSLERTRDLVTNSCPGATVIRSRKAEKFFKVVPDEQTVPAQSTSRPRPSKT